MSSENTVRMPRPIAPIRFLPPRPSKPSLTNLGRPRPSRLPPRPPPRDPASPFETWIRALPWRFFFFAFAVSAVTSFCLERYYAHEVRSHACDAR